MHDKTKGRIEAITTISEELYMESGIIPSAQELSTITKIPYQEIQRICSCGTVWQSKALATKSYITKLKKLNPEITQKELAEAMGLSTRQIRNILN